MAIKITFILTIIAIALLVGAVVFLLPPAKTSPAPSPSPEISRHPAALAEPVAQFRERVTKKKFGLFVTPQNSSVRPERFAGYHTGTDAEYGDVVGPVPVHAVAAGQVLAARWVSGYGGLVAIQHVINGQPMIGIYGHLDPASLIKTGSSVAVGRQIGILGQAFSQQTDGERKHLHFGLAKGSHLDVRGYVQNTSALSDWLDPLSLNF